MDPDRFQQVHKLFEAALEREPLDRAAFAGSRYLAGALSR
jgi:hypothetical protein